MLVLAGAIALSSCNASVVKRENTYKIEPEGGVETKDKNVFSGLGDVTFRMNQKYKITMMNDDSKEFHYLIINMKQKVGNKNIQDIKGVSLPISDGSHIIDCEHYYDVKIGKEEDASPPVCEFEVIGTVYPDGKAKLQKAK